MNAPWMISRGTNPYTRIRLFCFPYAGGSAAAYQRWHDLAPRGVQVCAVELPGRGILIQDPPVQDLTALVRLLADRIRPMIEVGGGAPFALFGHSMGGLIAYELARLLRECGTPPRHLFVSASATPGAVHRRRSLRVASDEEVRAELADLGGTPQWLLDEPELMELVLPTLRADYAALEGYEHRSAEPLDIPVTAFAGRSDTVVPPDEVRGWQRFAGGPFRFVTVTGDHFFLGDAAEQLLATVADAVGAGDALEDDRLEPERSPSRQSRSGQSRS